MGDLFSILERNGCPAVDVHMAWEQGHYADAFFASLMDAARAESHFMKMPRRNRPFEIRLRQWERTVWDHLKSEARQGALDGRSWILGAGQKEDSLELQESTYSRRRRLVREKMQLLKEELGRGQKEAFSMREELDRTRREKDTLQLDLQRLQEDRRKSDIANEEKVRQAEARARAARNTAEAHRADKVELEQALEQVTKDLEKSKLLHEQQVEELQKQQQEACLRHEEVQAKRVEEQQRLRDLQAQRLQLDTEVQNLRRAHEEAMSKLRAQHKDLRHFLKDLAKELDFEDTSPQPVPISAADLYTYVRVSIQELKLEHCQLFEALTKLVEEREAFQRAQARRQPATPPSAPRPPAPSVPPYIVAHLQTLELQRTAGAEEVKKAYRRLSLKYHPDKNGHLPPEEALEATAQFRKVDQAHKAVKEYMKTQS